MKNNVRLYGLALFFRIFQKGSKRMDNYEEAVKRLKKYKQHNVLSYLESRSDNITQEELIKQILTIDFEKMQQLYENTKEKDVLRQSKIEPVAYVDKKKLTQEEKAEYSRLAKNVIEKGHYAVATMAGGQGTRLGCKGPKGKYKLEVEPEGKYLFQILVENLQKANKQYKTVLPWYIMTSRENHEETITFLQEHNYFGYPKEAITFFSQGELPLIDKQGEILIGEEGFIKEASDGNGGIFFSMKKSGVLENMKKRGIQWVFIGSVDNVLLEMVDPILLGLTIKENHKIGTKSVVKASPEERVGVFCKKNGAPGVIEYTELPQEMAKMTDEKGELVYGESHIMCNLFSMDALEKIAEEKLPYHTAVKKASYLKPNGEMVVPEEPNSYKFESFIFDSFGLFEDISVLRGIRSQDFAPVKNATGNDSPQTAKKLYEENQRNK